MAHSSHRIASDNLEYKAMPPPPKVSITDGIECYINILTRGIIGLEGTEGGKLGIELIGY